MKKIAAVRQKIVAAKQWIVRDSDAPADYAHPPVTLRAIREKTNGPSDRAPFDPMDILDISTAGRRLSPVGGHLILHDSRNDLQVSCTVIEVTG
jgi:hypothetical protein